MNTKKTTLILSCFLLAAALFGGCAAKKPILSPAPVVFDGVGVDMKSAGYWISKINNPDNILLNKQQIEKLNNEYFKSNLLKDILTFKDSYYRKFFANAYKKTLNSYKKYYDSSLSQKGVKEFIDEIDENINYDILSKNGETLFALTVKSSPIRILPSSQVLYSSLETEGLDRIQATQINLGTPVAVMYATKDGNWFFVAAPETEGWIARDDIAFCSKEELRQYLNRQDKQEIAPAKTISSANAKSKNDKTKNPSAAIAAPQEQNVLIMTISPVTDIYEDKAKTRFLAQVNMGTELSAIKIEGGMIQIKMPYRDKNENLKIKDAFVDLSDISVGYLKYTQRNVLTQAFKQLNSPYGWGGQNEYQDCSSFLKNIFSCFGLKFPRNSSSQIRQSANLKNIKFNKETPLAKKAQTIRTNAIAAMSLLYLPGHIMLYIGFENDNLYVIHSIWGYGDKNNTNRTFIINRAVVTNTDLGGGSKKGSLLERITEMKVLSN
ncbi:MAG: SH3 domain-containing protein [Elusimicrobiota bacterium]|jgi:cell wall-associated NlpC family hydrolase|nr:SH3 domain-containing protein [Elusimicrobiota bacterium]